VFGGPCVELQWWAPNTPFELKNRLLAAKDPSEHWWPLCIAQPAQRIATRSTPLDEHFNERCLLETKIVQIAHLLIATIILLLTNFKNEVNYNTMECIFIC